jgi:transcriptional regulator with XRE-family HTH domain
MNVPPLIEILRRSRANRRISQLELAMSLGVSQRHVSFVESGRAKPSRGLLIAWLRELETPLEQRNAALLGAGYAPAYPNAALGDASLAPAIEALRLLISAHDPGPAFVLDAQWNLIDLNAGAKRLASLLAVAPPAGPTTGAARVTFNMLDALAAPGGFARRVRNLDEVGPALLARLRREERAIPALAPRVRSIADMLKAELGSAPLHDVEATPRAPLLATNFDTPLGPLAFFSMFTTFGTPQDITLASLRVELLFAADAATAAIWQEPATGAASSNGRDEFG